MASFRLIQTTTLASPSSTITFSSIPQTFDDLYIIGVGKSTVSGWSVDNLRVRINGDTGNSYYYQLQYSSAGSPNGTSVTKAANGTYVGSFSATDVGTWTTTFSTATLYFSNYRSNSNKAFQSTAGTILGGSPSFSEIRQGAHNWVPTSQAAINTIMLYSQLGGNFATGSSYSLYGIKNS